MHPKLSFSTTWNPDPIVFYAPTNKNKMLKTLQIKLDMVTVLYLYVDIEDM